MEQTYLAVVGDRTPASRLRDVIAVPFRYRRLLALSFLVTLVGAVAAVLLIPARYETEMDVLVRHDRVDPVVSADSNTSARPSTALNEQDVNSEVDLLKSHDLLEQTAIKSGLVDRIHPWWLFGRNLSDSEKRAAAVESLDRNINVAPPKQSNLIKVTYQSTDPLMCAKVLNSLADLYLDKHLNVHSPSGAAEFFQNEADRYKKTLASIEKQLTDFSGTQGVVSADAEKQSALDKLAQFEANWQQTQVSIRATEQKIADLQKQMVSTPARQTTQVRMTAGVLQSLKTTLYNLELKRAELAVQFKPGYKPLDDLNKQIESTRATIAEAEQQPVREETTDENPAYGWLNSELVKAKAELASLKASSAALSASMSAYRNKALALGEKGMTQQELLRTAKLTEEKYLLYVREAEDARVSDELNRQRLANVSIAQAAMVPTLPTVPMRTKIILAIALAALVSIGLTFGADFLDPNFRTPAEVQKILGVTVLGAIPGTEPHLLGNDGLDREAETHAAPSARS